MTCPCGKPEAHSFRKGLWSTGTKTDEVRCLDGVVRVAHVALTLHSISFDSCAQLPSLVVDTVLQALVGEQACAKMSSSGDIYACARFASSIQADKVAQAFFRALSMSKLIEYFPNGWPVHVAEVVGQRFSELKAPLNWSQLTSLLDSDDVNAHESRDIWPLLKENAHAIPRDELPRVLRLETLGPSFLKDLWGTSVGKQLLSPDLYERWLLYFLGATKSKKVPFGDGKMPIFQIPRPTIPSR